MSWVHIFIFEMRSKAFLVLCPRRFMPFLPFLQVAGRIDMDLDFSDDNAEGDASPHALERDVDTVSVSSAEVSVDTDIPEFGCNSGFPDTEELCGSSDTEQCSHCDASDLDNQIGMELSTSDEGESDQGVVGRDGMDIDCDSEQEAEAAVKPANGWTPGQDCGSYEGFGTPLVQVIISNLFVNACHLGSELSKQILQRLLPSHMPRPTLGASFT